MPLNWIFPAGIDDWQLVAIVAALVAAGVVKGATGAGAPIIAIPVMATIVDVRFATVVMLMPNLLTNIWQAYHFRKDQPDRSFLWPYVGAGAVGIVAGTVLLASLSLDALSLVVAFSLVAYIAFRLLRPEWKLSLARAGRLALPAGFAAGLLQGSTGLAAPALLSFLSAIDLSRLAFVATVSLLFVSFSITHIASLAIAGILTGHTMLLSLLALPPVAIGMVLGHRLLYIISARTLNRIVLVLLAAIAIQILWDLARRF